MSNQMNLTGTRCYLAGPMEFADGRAWRVAACEALNKLGVKCLNPYEDFFLGKIPEDGLYQKIVYQRENKLYEDIESLAKNVRSFDLSAVAKSDFLIAYIDTSTFCFGTIEELSEARRLNKPCYVIVEQGKDKAPFWLFGLVGHKYIYYSLDDIMKDLSAVNENIENCDSDSWSLLIPSLR